MSAMLRHLLAILKLLEKQVDATEVFVVLISEISSIFIIFLFYSLLFIVARSIKFSKARIIFVIEGYKIGYKYCVVAFSEVCDLVNPIDVLSVYHIW